MADKHGKPTEFVDGELGTVLFYHQSQYSKESERQVFVEIIRARRPHPVLGEYKAKKLLKVTSWYGILYTKEV